MPKFSCFVRSEIEEKIKNGEDVDIVALMAEFDANYTEQPEGEEEEEEEERFAPEGETVQEQINRMELRFDGIEDKIDELGEILMSHWKDVTIKKRSKFQRANPLSRK
eukprot:SAG11_NODE_910_length_6585_cov_7.205520_4_plen_108_part_00